MVETVLQERSYSTVPFRSILDMICGRQGIMKARERAHSFAEKSRALLTEFPDSPYQRALLAVTDLVTERSFYSSRHVRRQNVRSNLITFR